MKTTMYYANERLTCAVRGINLLIALVFTLTSTVYGIPSNMNMMQTTSGQEEKVQPVEPVAVFLDPDKLVVPENYGTVTERFKSAGTENSRKLIIQIQDSHCNYEAQTNIMKIMEGMSADKETAQAFKLIATEGADGALDASFPRSFPNGEVKKQASDYFLRIGWLTGPEMYAINFKEEPVPLWGVEDQALYDENLMYFRKTKAGLEKERAFLDRLTALIEILKMKILSKGVNDMVKMREGWDKNTVQFTDYCTYIEKIALENGMGGKGATVFKDAIEYPNFTLVIESMEIEKKIDTKKIDSERQMMIAQLQARMVKEELAELVKQSLYLRTGKITSDMFYSYLQKAAEAKKIDITKYPNLGGYMEIVFRNSKVNAGALFEEIDRIEKAIKNRLYTGEAERKLDEMIDQVKLLRNLLDLRMTRRDLANFKERRRFLTPAELIRRVAMISEESGMKDALAGSIGWLETNKEIDLAACEGFYDAAIKRDKVLAENTIDEMEKRKATAVALVTGGFHTQGTKELFKAKGYSYVVVTPRMTQTYDDKYYLARMMNEQSEFDKMFSNAGTRLAAPDMLSEERKAEFCRAFYIEVATILSKNKKASEINAALNAWLQEPVNAEIAKLIGSEVRFINAVPKGKTCNLIFQFTSDDGSVVERTFAYDSGKEKEEERLALVSEKPLARVKRVAAAEKAIAPEARQEAPAAEEPVGPTDADIRASLDELIAQHPDLIRREEKEGEARYQVRRTFVQNKSIVFDKSENAWIECRDAKDALKKINTLLATIQKPSTLDDLMAKLRVPSTRSLAEEQLTAFGNKAVSSLNTRLSSRAVSADERAAIARILGAIGTPMSIAALKKMLDGEKESTVISEVIRGLAVSADPTVIPVIANYLGNQDKDIAFEAQEGLIKIGEPAVDALTTMLKGRLNMSVDSITRAVDTLAVIADRISDVKKRDAARNAIMTVVKDGNLNEKKLLARFAAVRALTEMRDADGATAAFFKRMLGREDLPAGYSAGDLLEPVCVRMAQGLNDNQKNYYKNTADKTVAMLLEREVDIAPLAQLQSAGVTAHVLDIDETQHMDTYAVQQYLEKGIPSSKPPVTVTVDKLAEEYGVVLNDDLLASLKDVEVVIDEVDIVGYAQRRLSKMDMEPVKALSGEVNGKKRIRMTRGYLDRMRAYGLRTALADVLIHEDAELVRGKSHDQANDDELGGRPMSYRILLDMLIAKERGNAAFLRGLVEKTQAALLKIAENTALDDETKKQRSALTRNIEVAAEELLKKAGTVDQKTIARELKDQIKLLAQPQYAMAGYGSRGDEGLPNEEYTTDIRSNLESGNYVALSYNDTKKSLETSVVQADSGVTKLSPPAETVGDKAMAEFNRLLDMLKKEDGAMAAKIKGITFILMRNQRPHYGLGRPQIYLDLNKLEADPAAFMESLRHEINERSAIVAGLGAENMKFVEETKNNPQSRRTIVIYQDKPNENNLAAEIDRLAAVSHNEQVNKELNDIVALRDGAQLNKILTETRKAIGDIEANTAYTDRVKELMKTRYEEKATAVRMALLKIRLEQEIKRMPEKSVIRAAAEEILAALATDNYRKIEACLMDARSVMPFDGGKSIDEIVKSLLNADKDALGKFIGYVLNRAGYIGHNPKMNSDFDNLCLALAAAYEARETPRGLVLIDSMFKGMTPEEINMYLEKVVLKAAGMGLDMVFGLGNEFYAEHKSQVDAIVQAVMQKHPKRRMDQILIVESDRVVLAQKVNAAAEATSWKGNITLAVGMDELHLYSMMAQRVVNLLLSDGNSLSMADIDFLKTHGLGDIANFERLLPIVQHGKDMLDAKQQAFNTFGFAA